MIVICTGCQARFRVADEKIGPRGAKVRCTRCQNVFVVKREAVEPTPRPPTPNIDLDLTPGLARPAPPQDPFTGAPAAGASVIPFPATGPGRPAVPAPDPFVAAGLDVFGNAEASGDDPFARAAAGFVDEVGAPPPAAAAPPPALVYDPFAVAAQEPFAAAGTTGAQALPVTDLAQLLGAAPAALASPSPSLTAPPRAAPLPQPPRAAADDLALEEHSGSIAGPIPAAPAPFADPGDVQAAEPDFFAMSGAVFNGGAVPGEESLALATEKTPAPPPVRPAPASPPPPADEAAGFSAAEESWAQGPLASTPPPAPLAEEPPPAEPDLTQPPPPAGEAPAHRVRNAALNALALVALLVLALAIRVVLRGDVPLSPEALRPSTLLRSFGSARPAGFFDLEDVKSGVYPQSSGGTVLFVRGVVVCRPTAPVEAVKVEAELVRDGQVLSRGEVLAGAVPSPEDVYRATDRAALDALTADLRKRAPKQVASGDRLGFLITLGDAPADLSGTSVRVQAAGASH